jgi:charged multivesicular body protein 1
MVAVREKRRQVTLKSEAARADVIINELKAAQSTRDTRGFSSLCRLWPSLIWRSPPLGRLLSWVCWNVAGVKNREFQIARIHAASAVREKRRQVTLKSEAARADAWSLPTGRGSC